MIKLFRDTDIGGSLSGGPDPIPPKIRMMIEAEYPVLIGKDTFTKKSKLLAEVQQDAAEFGYSLSLPTIQAQEERIRVLEEALRLVVWTRDLTDEKTIVSIREIATKALTPKTNKP